jgi:hypothetical protein
LDELSRREFFALAAALGASTALAGPRIQPSRTSWRERRDLYPEGVASGDPTFITPATASLALAPMRGRLIDATLIANSSFCHLSQTIRHPQIRFARRERQLPAVKTVSEGSA